jgi:hypothetical protein
MFPLVPLTSILAISDEIVRAVAPGKKERDLALHLARDREVVPGKSRESLGSRSCRGSASGSDSLGFDVGIKHSGNVCRLGRRGVNQGITMIRSLIARYSRSTIGL